MKNGGIDDPNLPCPACCPEWSKWIYCGQCGRHNLSSYKSHRDNVICCSSNWDLPVKHWVIRSAGRRPLPPAPCNKLVPKSRRLYWSRGLERAHTNVQFYRCSRFLGGPFPLAAIYEACNLIEGFIHLEDLLAIHEIFFKVGPQCRTSSSSHSLSIHLNLILSWENLMVQFF